MSHDFWASATDPARAADWTEVFGDNRVPIVSPLANVAILPHSGISSVYLLAMDQLTDNQFEALVVFTAARFHADPEFVRKELRAQGMPIPIDGVTVTVLNPQKWFDVDEGEQP